MSDFLNSLDEQIDGIDAPPRPWADVTDQQVREAIVDSALVPIVEALESVAVPPLPLAATLPRAIVLAGCALSEPVADYDPLDETDQRRGVELCRLQIGTAYGQALNVWHLLVAESGSGKDVGGVMDRLAARLGWSIGTSGSAEGLADSFTEIGNGLLSISEFSPWLDPKHWQAKATSWLTAAFNRGWFKMSLSNRTSGTRHARYCFPDIAANVQPETLARFASIQNVADGFLPRFLFTRMPRLKWRPAPKPEPGLLERAEAALERYRLPHGVVTVPDGYLQHVEDLFYEHEAPFPAHWKRLVNEYGPRFAVMLAVPYDADMLGETVQDTPGKVTLTESQWHGAAVLIKWFYSYAEIALASVAEDEREAKYERRLAQFYRYIDKHGPVMLRSISQNCGKGTSSLFRLKLLEELKSRGLVETDPKEGSYFTTQIPPPKEWTT